MERFVRLRFFIAHKADDTVDRVLIQKPLRSPNQQAWMLVKLDIRWKDHPSV
jgi:hypothetical protein